MHLPSRVDFLAPDNHDAWQTLLSNSCGLTDMYLESNRYNVPVIIDGVTQAINYKILPGVLIPVVKGV